MVDFVSFEKELMDKLKRDKMLFVSEIVAIGRKYILTDSQIQRMLDHAEHKLELDSWNWLSF